jgi:tripartite-type tricarboxylate transporter receptor subunit TctC
LGELGYKAANINSVFGVFAPAATSPALIARYNAEINKALASPELRAKLTATDNVPTGGSPAAFAKEIATEFESNARIVKAAGIKAD